MYQAITKSSEKPYFRNTPTLINESSSVKLSLTVSKHK